MTFMPSSEPFSWGRTLSAIGQGLSQGGQPGGSFGQGVMQGAANYDAGQDRERQIELDKMTEELRRIQIEQARTANSDAATQKTALNNWLASKQGPMAPNNGRPGGMAAPGPMAEGWTPERLEAYRAFPELAQQAMEAEYLPQESDFKPNVEEFFGPNNTKYKGYLDKDGQIVRTGDSAPLYAPKSEQNMSIDFNGDGIPDFTMGSGNVKLTEAQSKDTGWATRLEGAVADMASAESEGYDPTAGGATMDYIGQRNVGGLIGNLMTSDKGKKWYRGAKEALAVILRKDSGGAITPDEFKMYGPIYLPMPWDDPATKAAKNQAIRTTLGALKTTSGGGYDVNKARVEAEGATTPAPTPTAATPQYKEGDTATNPQTNEKLVFRNGQWVPQ